MAYSSDITIDFNNMIADTIGPAGIKASEIEELGPQIRQAFRGLADLRKLGQLPFRDLPYQEETLEKIKRQAERIRDRSEAVLLLGTGGLSLGATCLLEALSIFKPKAVWIEGCVDIYALN